MDRQPQTVALIPANDEEMSIAGVVLQAHRYVDKVTVCDCGSRDKIGEIAEALGATVIKHEQNMGYKATLSMLLEEARKLDLDVMVTLDA
nr:hypothetical protein [Candidatus Njordarchaeota archaeon]